MIIGSKTGKKYSGMYKGQVLSILNDGILKVWIPGVYPETWAAEESNLILDIYGKPSKGPKIPGCRPAIPCFGSFGKTFACSWPEVNTKVWCFFEDEDPNLPVYFAMVADEENMGPQNSVMQGDREELRIGPAYIRVTKDQKLEIGFDPALCSDRRNNKAASGSSGDSGGSSGSGDSGAVKIPATTPVITMDTNGNIDLAAQNITIHATDQSKLLDMSGSNGLIVGNLGATLKARGDVNSMRILGGDNITILARHVNIQGHCTSIPWRG